LANSLEARQLAMRQRMAKQRKTVLRKAARSRAPKLPRGVFVGQIRRDRPVCDIEEMQRLVSARLRSPRTDPRSFNQLLEHAQQLGLCGAQFLPKRIETPEREPTIHELVVEFEREQREQRKKAAKETSKRQ
jgi:hypothetical protein